MNRRLNRRQALRRLRHDEPRRRARGLRRRLRRRRSDPFAATANSEFDDAASCEATAELTEGPYYFDADAVRSDIREDRPGAALKLGVRVRSAGECAPIKDAVVDIWHCDAGGIYSGFEEQSPGQRGRRTARRRAAARRRRRVPWRRGPIIAQRRRALPARHPGHEREDGDGYRGLMTFDVSA